MSATIIHGNDAGSRSDCDEMDRELGDLSAHHTGIEAGSPIAWANLRYSLAGGVSLPEDWREAWSLAIKTRCCGDIAARGWQLLSPVGVEHAGDVLRYVPGEASIGIRLPVHDIEIAGALSGKVVDLDAHLVGLGKMQVSEVAPAPVLSADVVIWKTKRHPFGSLGFDFAARAGKHLAQMFGHTQFSVAFGERCRFELGGVTLHGYPVTVGGISRDEALKLQLEGLGGLRSVGCGVFCAD